MPVADVASVAVLPFENLTGNPSDQFLSDGMTEEVIGQLAQVRGLKVISRTSTEALKGTHLTLRQIAETLGVRHVLEGSVRHAGNRIRVAVDLIDATTDGHVWTSSYDRDLTDVFAVQEEVARHVADSLVSTVGVRPTMGRVSRTEHPGAYEAYLAGRYLMYRRTQEGLRGALKQFQQALAQDSTYAPAYAGLASVYHLWVTYSYRGIDLYEAYGRAVAMADRAIAIDPDVAEAYAARGRAMTSAWAPAEGIAADFKRALELRPNSTDVHQWYAVFLSRQDRHDEALTEMERAISLDPLAPGVRLGFSYVALAARRYDVAAREAGRAAALEPSLVLAREHQALGDLLSGTPPAAPRSVSAPTSACGPCAYSRSGGSGRLRSSPTRCAQRSRRERPVIQPSARSSPRGGLPNTMRGPETPRCRSGGSSGRIPSRRKARTSACSPRASTTRCGTTRASRPGSNRPATRSMIGSATRGSP
jgi:Predicted integral membrane protein